FDNASGNATASTMDSSNTLTPYHSQIGGAWTSPVLAPSFGSLSGDVLLTNQGGPDPGSVDYFTPSGGVGTLATFPSQVQPSGAFNARGLLFTTMSGQPTLLFSNTRNGTILKAGPGDIVPS